MVAIGLNREKGGLRVAFLVRNGVKVLMAEDIASLEEKQFLAESVFAFHHLGFSHKPFFANTTYYPHPHTFSPLAKIQMPKAGKIIILFLNCTVHANFVILSCFGLSIKQLRLKRFSDPTWTPRLQVYVLGADNLDG